MDHEIYLKLVDHEQRLLALEELFKKPVTPSPQPQEPEAKTRVDKPVAKKITAEEKERLLRQLEESELEENEQTE